MLCVHQGNEFLPPVTASERWYDLLGAGARPVDARGGRQRGDVTFLSGTGRRWAKDAVERGAARAPAPAPR